MPSVMFFFYREKAGLHSQIRKQATQLNEATKTLTCFVRWTLVTTWSATEDFFVSAA